VSIARGTTRQARGYGYDAAPLSPRAGGQAGRARGSSASVIGVFRFMLKKEKGLHGYGPAGSHSLFLEQGQ